jgi:hypothetical protein
MPGQLENWAYYLRMCKKSFGYFRVVQMQFIYTILGKSIVLVPGFSKAVMSNKPKFSGFPLKDYDGKA